MVFVSVPTVGKFWCDEVMASKVDLAIFGLAPVAAILVMAMGQLMANYDEVRENWSAYRCNPMYMPFVALFQSEVSTADNFNHCIGSMSKEVLKVPIDSIQVMMNTFAKTLQGVAANLNIFRTLRVKLSGVMLSMTTSIMGKLTGLVGAMSHLLIKSMDTIKRIAATGYIGLIFANILFNTVKAFWTLSVSILRGFIFATIAIGIAVILFTYIPLAMGLTMLALFAAAGGFSTF